jgi:hypothetical protein
MYMYSTRAHDMRDLVTSGKLNLVTACRA